MPQRLAFCNGTQSPNESTTYFEERFQSTIKKSKYSVIKDLLSLHWRPRNKDLKELRSFWTLKRRRETPFSFEKESVRTNKVLAGCPQHQYSHCGLCQPECRRAGKSSDTQFPNMTLSNTIRMMWRPKHALKTAKQPGHATIGLTVTQRPPCESIQIPKDNLKPKDLREAKKTNNRSLLRHNQTLIASFTGEKRLISI